MATVYVTLETVRGRSGNGAALLIPDSVPAANTEAVATSGTNAMATAEGAGWGQVWVVEPIGGDVMMAAGPDPDAENDPQRRLTDGEGPYYFAVMGTGEKLAFVDAA